MDLGFSRFYNHERLSQFIQINIFFKLMCEQIDRQTDIWILVLFFWLTMTINIPGLSLDGLTRKHMLELSRNPQKALDSQIMRSKLSSEPPINSTPFGENIG
jgi:hypothetical protein